MAKKIFTVSVSYSADLYPEYDDVLASIAHTTDSGSGMGFGERDLSFSFGSLKTALGCFERMLDCRKLISISLIVNC